MKKISVALSITLFSILARAQGVSLTSEQISKIHHMPSTIYTCISGKYADGLILVNVILTNDGPKLIEITRNMTRGGKTSYFWLKENNQYKGFGPRFLAYDIENSIYKGVQINSTGGLQAQLQLFSTSSAYHFTCTIDR